MIIEEPAEDDGSETEPFDEKLGGEIAMQLDGMTTPPDHSDITAPEKREIGSEESIEYDDLR